MYANGLLATVDVNKLAEAQVCVFEAMDKNAGGRYLCFDDVVEKQKAVELAREIRMPINRICGNLSVAGDVPARFRLSNKKLSSLITITHRCCDREC